ncbi:MAG: DUF1810 domain-containing protein [Xanthomonadales bacterium]|nr:DUF1810 domain-containing protein [Xanthomonadales bacterium]
MQSPGDHFDLNRFTQVQEDIYTSVLSELKSGRKRTHWMWFIFPQFEGLGRSPTAKFYAIKSLEEARQYLQNPVLGARLLECSKIVLGIEGSDISDIFGFPDDLKLKSSMTLFSKVADPGSVFDQVLDKYFQGASDTRTLELIAIISNPTNRD